jgi:putative ABC transport system substrate-binding protein
MQATSTIPIVMAISADALGSGLVSNLGRPGKNVTGVTIMLAEMSAKRLQLLKEAVPNVSRVAVLWNPALPWHPAMLREVEAAAPSLATMRMQQWPCSCWCTWRRGFYHAGGQLLASGGLRRSAPR